MLLPLCVTLGTLGAIALLVILAEPSAAHQATSQLRRLANVIEAHATARYTARLAYSHAYRSMRSLQSGRAVE